MPLTLIVGALWGDEGKGRVAYELAREADLAVRCTGGPNAMHTVFHRGEKFVLRQVPAALLHGDVTCTTGDGMVLNPISLAEELEGLRSRGIKLQRLRVCSRAHVITPWHVAEDSARDEEDVESAIGTTRQGMGPALVDKVRRVALRMEDLLDAALLRRALESAADVANDRAAKARRSSGPASARRGGGLTASAVAKQLRAAVKVLAPHLDDTSALIRRAVRSGKHVVVEGSQGTLLDVDHGSWPYVTSSHPTAGGMLASIGVGPRAVTQVVGVTRAYATRQGNGPFPTELPAREERAFRDVTRDFSIRVGWLDLDALRFAAELNGFTELVLTSVDRLSGLPRIKVATGPRKKLQALPGWRLDPNGVRVYGALPSTLKGFIERVETEVGVPIRRISASREGGLLNRS